MFSWKAIFSCLLSLIFGATVSWAVPNIEEAAERGEINVIERFLKKGGDPNRTHSLGRTLLHISAEKGHLDIVQLLIKHGAQVDVLDDRHETPLFLAVYEERDKIVRALVQGGADVNRKIKPQGNYLFMAVQRKNLVLARELLECGANVNSKDPVLGRSPLGMASTLGSLEMVKLLVENGADVNQVDYFGISVLGTAIGNQDIEAYLVANGARIKKSPCSNQTKNIPC